MSLFEIPTRLEKSVEDIRKKSTQNVPKIKMKGSGTLLDRLGSIERNVEKNLGDYNPILLDTDSKFIGYCKNAAKDIYVSIDTETTGLTWKDQTEGLVGVCIKSLYQTEAYAPVGHLSAITYKPLKNQVSKEAIKTGFEYMKNCRFIFHNAYYDLIVLKAVLGYFPKIYWDTLPAAFLLDENEPHGLKYLYDKYVMEGQAGVHKFAELFDGVPFCYIKPSVGIRYAAHDSLMTEKLFLFQKPYLTVETDENKEYNLEEVANVYHTEELPVIEVLADMKWRGIEIDIDIASKLADKYEKLKQEALNEFNKVIEPLKGDIEDYIHTHKDTQLEYPVNYNSPIQIQILLYDILKSGVIYYKIPTGTGKEVMNVLINDKKYENTQLRVIALALNKIKKYDKALGSFVYKLKDLALASDKHIVRPDYNSCAARTGRLSSSGDFNGQQLPSKMGDIRNMFYAGNGRAFVFADYSREELAVAASISKDEKLIKAFQDGVDVYSHVASLAFDKPYEDCCEFCPDGSTNKEGKQRRSAAKAICLGIMYSKGVGAIADDLNVTKEKAQEIYDSVMKAFPTLAQWLQDVQAFARKNGYVDGYYGRRRRLPELLLPDYQFEFPEGLDNNTKEYYTNVYKNRLKAEWDRTEKQSIIREAKRHGIVITDNTSKKAKCLREVANSVIQGSSADICKIELISIYNDKIMQELDAKLEMSIHDEVAVSCPIGNVEKVKERLKYLAVNAASKLPMKLSVDIDICKHWYMGDFDA